MRNEISKMFANACLLAAYECDRIYRPGVHDKIAVIFRPFTREDCIKLVQILNEKYRKRG